jgi:hypothetical protein
MLGVLNGKEKSGNLHFGFLFWCVELFLFGLGCGRLGAARSSESLVRRRVWCFGICHV